jgi:hypothetical protein
VSPSRPVVLYLALMVVGIPLAAVGADLLAIE